MTGMEPRWISVALACWIHAEQIAAYGGASGLRDRGRLEAALDRPRNLFLYEDADLFRMAASYAHGIVAGHPFVDGNKRASLVVCLAFLDANGIPIEASDDETYDTWIGIAKGEISEPEIADWLSRHAAQPRRS